MGMTAGVMILLSFLELVSEAWQLGDALIAKLRFGAGVTFMFLLDFYIDLRFVFDFLFFR